MRRGLQGGDSSWGGGLRELEAVSEPHQPAAVSELRCEQCVARAIATTVLSSAAYDEDLSLAGL
jgi:hypothetical protein